MLTNVAIGNHEIDCILLTEKGPFLIDCKAYQGKITGCENGNWYVQTFKGNCVDVGKNLFLQAKKQRFAFLQRWEVIAKKHLKKQIPKEQRAYIKAWLYFKPGSKYVDDRLDMNAARWFGIVTRDTLVEELRKCNIQYRISELSYEKILKEFGLSIVDAKEVTVNIVPDTDPEPVPEIEPEIIPDPEKKEEDELKPEVEPEVPDEKQVDEITPPEPAVTPEKTSISIPVVIQRGPIQITIPVRPKSRPPELVNAVNEASTYLEMDRLDQALNLANYALSLDKYDREAQDIKYEILYRLKRGEEAEAFIEEILLGE
jgi:tetratricopeptide (TPR) repeat protein